MGNTLPSFFATSKPTASATPLLQPCISGNIGEVKTLIGRHIASHDKDGTTSTTASSSSPLLKRYVNAADGEGNTALIGAAFGGHLHIIQFLMEECGADVTLQNKIGCSAIWIAAGYGHVHVLEYLIQAVKAISTTGGSDEENDWNMWEIISQANFSGDTPLLASVSKGHTEIVKTLLSVTRNNNNDDDATTSDTCECWKLLTIENKAGDTPLSVAVGMGYEGPMLNLLLDTEETLYKILPGRKNETSEKTPDDDNNKNNGICDPIISRPLHSKNIEGLTPLLVACERNFKSIVEELVRRGADPSTTTDEKGRTPLAIASFCDCMDVVEYLLSIGTDETAGVLVPKASILNQRDVNGCTPLWLAARTGNLKMVKVLMDAGANESIEDNDGLSPKAVATKFQKKSVEEYFQREDI